MEIVRTAAPLLVRDEARIQLSGLEVKVLSQLYLSIWWRQLESHQVIHSCLLSSHSVPCAV